MTSREYHRPVTMDEALDLASAIPGSMFVAGGTDLLVQMDHGRLDPPALISLWGLDELGGIEVADRVRIGAMVPLSDVQAHPVVAQLFPALVGSITTLGSRQIRNVATMGGNLCNASPAADTAPPLVAYGASIELKAVDGSREVTVEDFLIGPGRTSLRPGEIVTGIFLDLPAAPTRSVFMRKGRVKMDLAIASVAAVVEMKGSTWNRVRLAAGAVAPVPMRLTAAERIVEGTTLDAAARMRAVEAARAEISPITDLRSSAGYRRHLTGVLLDRALQFLHTEPQ